MIINTIKQYIPQREPFIMVSELCSATENMALSRFQIPSENIFCSDGYFQEPGIIENIAQTAAALSGYNALINKQEVKIGYIGSISKLSIYRLPECLSQIETTVTVEGQVLNVSIVKGIIKQNGELISECEMKIFLIEETL